MAGILGAFLAFAGAAAGTAYSAEQYLTRPSRTVTISSPFDLELAAASQVRALTVAGSASHGEEDGGQEAATEDAAVEAEDFLVGLFTPSFPGDRLRGLASWEESGNTTNAVLYFVDFTRDIEETHLRTILNSGRTPMVGWEPWEAGAGVDQPDHSLRSIIEGRHDGTVRRSAQNVARAGGEVLIRFAHEMNGDWYPWSERVNGNMPGEYVEAWKHVRSIFLEEGATNARWVWSPNVTTFLPYPLAPLWPGEQHVDALGIVGYLRAGQTFSERYDSTIAEVATLSDLPIIITETSVQQGAGRKHTVKMLACEAVRNPRIRGIVWFEAESRADWRLGDAAEDLRRGLAGECDHDTEDVREERP